MCLLFLSFDFFLWVYTRRVRQYLSNENIVCNHLHQAIYTILYNPSQVSYLTLHIGHECHNYGTSCYYGSHQQLQRVAPQVRA